MNFLNSQKELTRIFFFLKKLRIFFSETVNSEFTDFSKLDEKKNCLVFHDSSKTSIIIHLPLLVSELWAFEIFDFV